MHQEVTFEHPLLPADTAAVICLWIAYNTAVWDWGARRGIPEDARLEEFVQSVTSGFLEMSVSDTEPYDTGSAYIAMALQRAEREEE